MLKARYPCFPSTGCQRLPSCRPQTSLLECGERAKRPDLQVAVRPRSRTRKHHDVAASRRRGLRPASRRSSSDQPVALYERLLARPGDDARHDRSGLAILSDQFADFLAAGLAARAGQAGPDLADMQKQALDRFRHGFRHLQSALRRADGVLRGHAGCVLPRAERLAGQGMARQGCAAARLDRDPRRKASKNPSPRSSAVPRTSASSRC